ncbi:MAG: cbb3-type cytochrome c oxidase subunit I [Gammaproteobacteria bacterium]|nr:cbb3-type cytochrome c oxidase subunit I [Gammaproteobacteria bacterium]
MNELTQDHWLMGRLGLDSLAFVQAVRHPGLSELIASGAAFVVVLGAIVLLAVLTRRRAWRRLWSDWLSSVDHKRIGIMYLVLSFVMLGRGVIEGVLMRLQQADGLGGGFLTPEHFAELFSTHGTIMIFFVAMPFVAGFVNYVMPLQIGARDVSFPVLNQVSLALTAAGAALVMLSLVVGRFSYGGWTAYPPYTETAFQPGPGPDYWIWSVVIAGVGSTLTGVNFVVTIYKNRARGMNLWRMPLFTWTALCAAIILVFAMPPLTVACLMLALDRYLDFHFFTNDLGGNMMNYANLFWLFGHPEVYLLVLPAYGIFSEVVATYAGKRLFGYHSLVIASMAISVLAFTVWLHHFFTMGQGANVNIAFGIATMFIAVPTGVKVYDWMLTLYRGRIRMGVPMIYTAGFLILFVIGGLSGVVLANPTIDYQVHNTLFLVAHFHNVLIPGVLFAMLAGWHYWFPKMFGFELNERLGRVAALLWIPGFALTFLPLYVVGLMGMPRRSVSYSDPAFQPYMLVAGMGALLILCALAALVMQLLVSIRDRDRHRVPAGDPWNGRTLEWSMSAPPPEYNFAVLPEITDRDALAVVKADGTYASWPDAFEDIEMPRNTWLGAATGGACTLLGFALVFHVWWLAAVCTLAVIGAVIVHSFDMRGPRIVPASQVERDHRLWLAKVAEAGYRERDVDAFAIDGGAWANEERGNPI